MLFLANYKKRYILLEKTVKKYVIYMTKKWSILLEIM